MRLLPATRRGTWLTALAVWLVGCAGAWWLLPVRPRHVIPGVSDWLFVDNGRAVITFRYATPDCYSHQRIGPFSVWDLSTGHCTNVLLDDSWTLVSTKLYSPTVSNGRRFIVHKNGRFHVLDSNSGALLPLGVTSDSPYLLALPTADGRFAALQIGDRTLWCDLERAEVLHSLDDMAGFPTPDGRRLIVVPKPEPTADHPHVAVVFDTTTWQEVARLRTSESWVHLVVQFADAAAVDNDNLLIYYPRSVFQVRADYPGALRYESINALTGHSAPRSLVEVFVPELTSCDIGLVTTELNDDGLLEIRCWSSSDGRLRWKTHVPELTDVQKEHWISAGPDGVRLMMMYDREASQVEKWLEKVPILQFRAPTRSSRAVRLSSDTGEVINRFDLPSAVWFSPDGRAITTHWDDNMYVWDIPPRKPLTWLAAFAAAWGTLLAWLARRRVRRLTASVAA